MSHKSDKEDGMNGEQAVDWCSWCGRELYPGETVWVLDGAHLHEDCVGEFALDHFPHWELEEKRRTLV